MVHYTSTSSIEQKQQAYHYLQQFDADPKQWVICAQLIIEQDETLQFFGYKYVYNILVYAPNLIGSEEYELIQQKIINNIFSSTQNNQHQFLINKQFQVLIQMIFQRIIDINGFFDFCLRGITTSNNEYSLCAVLRLICTLFEQLNNKKIHYKKLTYQFKAQLEEYIKQNIDLTPFMQAFDTVITSKSSYPATGEAIQALNKLSRIYIKQQTFRLNNQCVGTLFQCYLRYCAEFQNDILLLQYICEGIMAIFNIVDLQVRHETYQQIMFLFHKIIQTMQKQQFTDQFMSFFIMTFAPSICQPKVFKALIAQQLQELGPQIGKDNYLLSSKAQNDAFNYFNKGLTLSDNKNEGYLFYLVFTILIIQAIPDNSDVFAPIQSFFECLIQNTQTLTSKFCKDFIKQLMPLCMKKIICTLQRPMTLKYYYNLQGYLERNDNNEYEDDYQYVEKLKILDLLYNMNKQLFKQLIQQLIDEIIKEQNLFLLQQVSIAYPKIYQLNQELAGQIIFMVLSFKNLISNNQSGDRENMMVLVNQMFLYMIKFNKLLLQDPSFAIQVMQQCFGIFASDAAEALYEYALETLLQIFALYVGKQTGYGIVQFLKDQVVGDLFQLANTRLTIFQIQDLYGAVLALMPDFQRQIVEPVQIYAHQNLQTLIQSKVLLQQNQQNALVQLFSVLESILRVVGTAIVEPWLKEDIVRIASMFHEQNIVNDTLNCHIYMLLQLVCNQQSDLAQLLNRRNEHLSNLLQNDAEVQNSDTSYLIIYQNFLEVSQDIQTKPDTNSVSQLADTLLGNAQGQEQICHMLLSVLECLISYQKRLGPGNVNPSVQGACAVILEIFLRGQCRLYQRYLLKDDGLRTRFLNCLISVAAAQELAGTEFISLYKRQRTAIQVHIFRRAGAQFLQFALQTMRTAVGEIGVRVLGVTGEYFILDLLQQALAVVGPQDVATTLNVDIDILRAIGDGDRRLQEEALHDVLVCIGANGH